MEKEHYWGDFQSFQLFLCPKELADFNESKKIFTETLGYEIMHISNNGEMTISDNQNLSLLISEGKNEDTWFAIDAPNFEDTISKLKSENCQIIKIPENQIGVLVKTSFEFKFYLSKLD